MRKTRTGYRTLAFSLFTALVLILSACGAQGTPTTSDSNSKPVKGGTWIDDLANEPDSLIPNASSQTFATMVAQSLYTPLFAGDAQGHINPAAAAELPTLANGGISQDLKTWTFKMRPGLKWSDGQPYNAEDVDFTWKLWTNPKFPAQNTSGFNLITSADVSADKMSITFHLKQAFAPFVASWTDGLQAPLPKHHFASIAPDQIAKSSENLNPQVVSGPFVMKESRPGDHYTVARNPNYYQAAQGLPYLDQVVFRVVANQDTVLKDLQSGAVTSAWFLDVSKMSSYNKVQNYKVVANPAASNYEVAIFNTQNPILKVLEVRKAIALAINHDDLIKTARQGQGQPLCTDHGKSYDPGYQADAPCPKFDPDAANALLEQAGWKKGSDGVRAKGGQKLEFTYSTTTGKPWRESDETLVQSNLQAVGIKLNIKNYPASTFFGSFMPNGKHDIAEFENSYVYDGDNDSFIGCDQIPKNGAGGQNWTFYCSQTIQQNIVKEQSSADKATRQAAFNEIHKAELTEFPFVILYGPTDPGIAKVTAHNYLPGPMGASETVNLWNWWCDGGKC